MNSEIRPLPIIPIVERLFEFAARCHDTTGITPGELQDIKTTIRGGHRPSICARGQICSDRYDFRGICLYVHTDFAALCKGEVLVCASLKKELLYIRAPQKHEQFDIVTDTVVHSEPL